MSVSKLKPSDDTKVLVLSMTINCLFLFIHNQLKKMKIIQELLKLKFPTVEINSLMEIITATPNPELATEILCGIYIEPNIGSHTRVQHRDRGICTFISYDKWNNELKYSYEEETHKNAYFPKGTLKKDINMENFDSLKVPSTGDTVWLSIPTGEFRTLKGSTNFQDWMELPYAVSIEEDMFGEK